MLGVKLHCQQAFPCQCGTCTCLCCCTRRENVLSVMSELKAGKEVILVDQNGHQRTAIVGHLKIETRPLILVEAETDSNDQTNYSILVQNAETARFVPAKGAPAYGYTLDSESCVLKFDGASDRNSGKCGAGAVLYPDDDTAVIELRQGLGSVSKTYAEYTALILGLKHALKRGYKKILVEGDSKLVCYQVQGTWRPNIHQVGLLQVDSDLKKMFVSFEMKHVFKMQNSGAYLQAHRAIKLGDGKVEVHIIKYVKRTVY